jgi:hypothetical protein
LTASGFFLLGNAGQALCFMRPMTIGSGERIQHNLGSVAGDERSAHLSPHRRLVVDQLIQGAAKTLSCCFSSDNRMTVEVGIHLRSISSIL